MKSGITTVRYILWEEYEIDHKNFIYLTRYNIESYFIEKEVVTRFMRSILKCQRSKVEDKILYDKWKKDTIPQLFTLFVLFATVKRFNKEIPNVNIGSSHFLDKQGKVKQSSFDEYLLRISQEIPDISEKISEVRKKMEYIANGEEYTTICGKYMYDSLCRHISYVCDKNVSREQFMSYLVSGFDITPLSFLKERILGLIA